MDDLIERLMRMTIGAALGFWYLSVRRSPAKVSFYFFALAIICVLLGLTSDVGIVIIVYTAFAGLFILSTIVHLMARNDEKSVKDVSDWTTSLLVLMFGTSALTLGMDYPNTKKAFDPLIIGIVAAFLAYVFRPRGDGSAA